MRPGDDLAGMLASRAAAEEVAPGDVVVVAHKAVSKAEGRIVALAEVRPGPAARGLAALTGKEPALCELILSESRRVVRRRGGTLICETHHGFVCANSGVDQSSSGATGRVVVLPTDPDASARRLRAALPARPAVVIADSFGRPWRLGQTDIALGAAGLMPLEDWTGRPDAYGRELRVTSIAVADAAAAAADLARAKDSRRPVVLVRGLERYVTDEDGPGAALLRRPPEQDLFR